MNACDWRKVPVRNDVKLAHNDLTAIEENEASSPQEWGPRVEVLER